MTLDETIKYTEEVAEKQENNAKSYSRPDKSVKGSGKKYNTYLKCAEEYRQIAEWLKDYKRLLEQEPCEDAISRQEMKQNIESFYNKALGKKKTLEFLIKCVENLPSVSVAEKVGHWEWNQYDYDPNFGNWHCSECGCIIIEYVPKKDPSGVPLYKYCPQCGCRLVDPQESEDEG